MDPFVVHEPTSWSKLRKLIEKGRSKAGFVPRYKPRCGAGTVELPPAVKVAKDEDGHYFVAGPHERYFRLCPGCEGPRQ